MSEISRILEIEFVLIDLYSTMELVVTLFEFFVGDAGWGLAHPETPPRIKRGAFPGVVHFLLSTPSFPGFGKCEANQ